MGPMKLLGLLALVVLAGAAPADATDIESIAIEPERAVDGG
jgi:hypothetical protein